MPDEFKKTELLTLPKKEGVEVVLTLLDKNGSLYVDIRERVTKPNGNGWSGWTKRGIAMPLALFAELAERSVKALEAAKVTE